MEPFENNQWDAIERVDSPAATRKVLGHEKAMEEFTRGFASRQMHHAWLVSGPRGIGKASLAYQFCRHIFGQENNSTSPDSSVDEEVVYSKIARGGNPNILHLSRPWDNKRKKFYSEITVDEIRRTVPFFGTTAAEGDWRICIVDTADDMNRNAANALLKILEEPPKQVLFLVLANSVGRILPTIRSRCRHLRLRPLDQENLLKVLEKFDCAALPQEKADLGLFNHLAMGSVRKALLLLSMDGIALYRKLDNIVSNNRPIDWQTVHKLTDELVRKKDEERYQMFLDLVRDRIGMQIHQGSDENMPISHLARLCEVWEKTQNNSALANSYNLDKKQVILNLFDDYSQLN